MKMRKIMAAGVAATLAVTSLAAVASAESLTFNMATTEGKLNFKSSNGTDFGAAALTSPTVDADDAMFVKATAPTTDATAKMESKPVVTIKGLKKVGTNAVEATASYEFKEYYYLGTAADLTANSTAANLANNTLWTTNATDNAETKKKEVYYVLPIYKDTAPEGSLVVTQWDRIDTMNVTVKGSYVTTSSDVYGKFGSEWWGVYAVSDIANWDSLTVAAGPADAGDFATELKAVVDGAGSWDYDSKAMNDRYALLAQTTNNATIMRADVWELSDTDAYNSTTDTGAQDTNQSYDSNGLGTSKNRFAGLASQVADFFNHKTNGTITLKFTAATATNSGWLNGGVPSTQIGIKNLLDANNFALYVNYETSTGSLEATTSVDKNAGTVTFDISEILADLGGQTKGVVTDLYYGLNQGIYYDTYGTGLLVEEVTLAYEDDAAEEDIVEEEEVEEEETEEEEVEEEVAEEEEEVELEEEEEEPAEEEEEEVDGEMFEEEETEEEDVNPGTGVALAVVPAMIAAAAAVVSKKRK